MRRIKLLEIVFFTLCAITHLAAGPAGSFDEGMNAYARKDFTVAERFFKQAVKEQPSRAEAHNGLGLVYVAQKRVWLAEVPFRQACDLDPARTKACTYLGQLYYAVGRFGEAYEAFTRAVRGGLDLAEGHYGLARTAEALGRPSEADKEYQKAIRLGSRTAATEYGLFLFRQGRGDKSLEILRQADARGELRRVTRAIENVARPVDETPNPLPLRFETKDLDVIVSNGASGRKHLVETMVGGVAILDFDGDSWPDIYISNGAAIPSLEKEDSSYSNRLFRNNRDRSFTDVTRQAGVGGSGYCMGVAAGDFDNDGWVDLFVTGVRGNILYRNRGDRTFEDVTLASGLQGDGTWSVAAGWLDFDNDGWLDLFIVRYVVWDPEQETPCGDATRGLRTYCHPRHYQPVANAVYRNQGDGSFRDVTAASGIAEYRGKGMSAAFGDYDNDGHLDIFVTNDSEPDFLFRNQGDGTFQEVGTPVGVSFNGDGRALSSMGVDFRDFDNDGQDDIFVTALSRDTFPLFRNVGDGTFVDVTYPARIGAASFPFTGWGTGIFDLNNDGWKDIFVADGHVLDNAELLSDQQSLQQNSIFLNRGNGSFEHTILPGAAFHRGAAFGDLDRDGKIDVVVTRLGRKPTVLWNTSSKIGNWVAVRLRGSRSNREGIGARLRLKTNATEQWNHVTTSVGYGSSSDPTVHFGLGEQSRITLLEVRWPSGAEQVLDNLEANQYLTLQEPE